VSNSRFK